VHVFGSGENLLDMAVDVKGGSAGFAAKADFKVLGFAMEPFKYEDKAEFDVVKTPGWKIGDAAKYKQVFPVGPISVTVSAGVSGKLGLDLRLGGGIVQGCDPDLALRIYGKAKPYLKVSGQASAGIGVPGFSIGIYGELTLIEAGLPFESWVQIGGQGLDEGAASAILGLHADLKFSINALAGELGVYVQCIKTWKKPIVDWNGFGWEDTIFALDKQIPLVSAAAVTDPPPPPPPPCVSCENPTPPLP
jgi:hypothetical protein